MRYMCGACVVFVCGACVVHTVVCVWYVSSSCVVFEWCLCGAGVVLVRNVCGACVVCE